MPNEKSSNLLTIPKDVGKKIVRSGAAIACPLISTDKFVSFCKERGLSINRKRLYRLERLNLFAPVFRVKTPSKPVRCMAIPPAKDNDWFKKRWAQDTTAVLSKHDVPDPSDRTREAYYSIFQIDHLALVIPSVEITVQLDSYLDAPDEQSADWNTNAEKWLEMARSHASELVGHEHRRAKALLCQFISNRYFPETQGDQRTIQVPHNKYSSDQWVSISSHGWDWYEFSRSWNPKAVERLFSLTPEKLRHTYQGLAVTQAHHDPMEKWYQLTQFVSLHERMKLKGDALLAETLRSGAFMLRLLYRDLYGEELPHPNEVTGQIITHFPELEVREDTRRYLEFVTNRFGLNPQPKVTLIVEGPSEEVAVTTIFQEYFGTHPGKYGIEIVVLGGVDAATGGKEDRFRAIIRLIDYLHHHQTFTFLILDNERYARKLKAEASDASSIHRGRRFVTRPEYIKVWKSSFEFDNFSSRELATALNELSGITGGFSQAAVSECSNHVEPGAELKRLYRSVTGAKLHKIKLAKHLVRLMLSPHSRRKVSNRPIVQTLERVAKLAARNPLPTRQEIWEVNQASKFLGKKSSVKRR